MIGLRRAGHPILRSHTRVVLFMSGLPTGVPHPLPRYLLRVKAIRINNGRHVPLYVGRRVPTRQIRLDQIGYFHHPMQRSILYHLIQSPHHPINQGGPSTISTRRGRRSPGRHYRGTTRHYLRGVPRRRNPRQSRFSLFR